MDRQYISDHNVIERYLAGQLSGAEEQAFEEAYLEDAGLLDELQAAERLRDGIRKQSRWSPILRSPYYAAAASALLAISLVFSGELYRENAALRERGFLANSTKTTSIPLVSLRGSAETYTVPPSDDWVVFQLDAGITTYDSYRAVLERRDGATWAEIWRRADLEPTREEIWIGLAGRELTPGDYEVRLDGRMSEWPPERFEEVSRTPFALVSSD